jgi:hypothetical protein
VFDGELTSWFIESVMPGAVRGARAIALSGRGEGAARWRRLGALTLLLDGVVASTGVCVVVVL